MNLVCRSYENTSDARMSSETVSRRRRSIVLWASVATAGIAVITAALAFFKGADTGIQIAQEGNVGDAREVVKLVMESYTSLITLVSAAFGAVAFLVTFQQNQRNS